MASSEPSADERGAPAYLDQGLLNLLDALEEPALIYLPGGRIAAVNRAAAGLSDLPVTGMTIGELLQYYDARKADGGSLISGDVPYVRTLRGEIVTHGERMEVPLPDGSVYRTVVTSTPIVIDGKVVAALSVWHDFNTYVRGLVSGPASSEPNGPVEGR